MNFLEAQVGIGPGSSIENTQVAGFSIVWIVQISTIGRSLAQTKLAQILMRVSSALDDAVVHAKEPCAPAGDGRTIAEEGSQ
jgi:hypothetical protein